MKSLEQFKGVDERRCNAPEDTTGVRAVLWAVVAFAFLGVVCVVAWKTDSFKAFGELFGLADHMSQAIHLPLMALAVVAAMSNWTRGGNGRKR